ncbi:MAG: carboxypeptidase-like regulatory domain-containing protein, partial [Methanomassiliicoccales archaeon]|nr:carboxypeptidase-like regulatory domain-containing protein [Methanomassiliicoccales archaeon]
GQQIPLDQVTSDDLIVDYTIVYNEAFYDTMLYRTFMGYGPSDVGVTEQGIPGISGSLSSMPSMQAWNMTNFRMVYRTAYYSPYPSTDVANHTDSWMAISYEDGIDLYNKISTGEVIGTVDLSSSSLYQGVVFLQYYDGAIVEGTAVSDSGTPMANLWVTVLDEYGIPHQVVQTDADGHYSLVAPFGKTTIVFSYGDLDARQLIGTELYSTTIDITYDQAMRVEADSDKDGQLDYLIDLDPVITAGVLSGQVYIDNDANDAYSSTADEALIGATVVFENQTNGYRVEAITTADGYEILGVSPMGGIMWVEYQGHLFGETAVTVDVDGEVVTDFAYEPAKVTGTITLEDGSAANGITVSLLDQTNGQAIEANTDASGDYSFEGLLPGNYTIQTPDGTVVQDAELSVSEGDALEIDLVLYESMRLTGLVSYDGEAVPNAMVGLSGDHGVVWVKSDSRGRYSVVLPKGDVSIYATASVKGQEAVYLSLVSATESATLDLHLADAVVLSGDVRSSETAVSGATVRLESRTSGAVFNAVTNANGGFRAVLPVDTYFVYMYDRSSSYWGDIYIDASSSSTFNLLTSVKITGKAWFDANGDGAVTSGETLSGVIVTVTDQDGRSVSVSTSSTGQYSIVLVSGKSYTLAANKNGYDEVTNAYSSLDVSVTNDLNMPATERQVNGTIAPGIPGITVKFTAESGSAVNKTAVTTANGSFSVSLAPGDYSIDIDQNVTPGDDSVKYQTMEAVSLTVSIGKDPAALSIQTVVRVLVSGAISPGGAASMVFDGPERTTVSATSTYSVYLQEGDYSLYVRVDNSSLRSADLSRVTINGSMTLNVAAATASQALIRAEIADVNTRSVNITIEQGGAYYNVTTSTSGLVTVYLASGTYNASVDHHTLTTVNLLDRYVRFTGHTTFDMTGALRNVIITTTRTLDNATILGQVLSSGTATPASLQFQATSETAMDLRVEVIAGNYSIELAPGNYSVYAVDQDNTNAYLGSLTVNGPGTFNHDIVLVEAFRLSGVTFANDVGVGAEMTVTGAVEHSFSSADDGTYELYLPAGSYSVTAKAELIEIGTQVSYAGLANVVVEDVTSKGITMERETVQDVDVTWDSSQKATISTGQTATYTIRVVNTGNVQDTFRLTTSGTGWTVVLSQTEVSLGYGVENSQIVTVQITPSSTILVKHTAVTVRATSTTNSSATDSVSLDATITPVRSVGLAYQTAKATDGADYVYTVRLSNLGNIDDKYTVTIGNLEALRELGWKAQLVDGTGLSDSLSLTIAASKTSDVQVSLMPLRQNPSPTVSVQVLAVSQNDDAIKATLDMEPEFVGLNTGGLSVTGDGVSDSMPKIGDDTIILVGATFTLMALLVILGIQKGVFSRRKR